MNYICKKGCHITDLNKETCPRCGGFLSPVSEKDVPSLLKNVEEMQRAAANDTASGRYVNYTL